LHISNEKKINRASPAKRKCASARHEFQILKPYGSARRYLLHKAAASHRCRAIKLFYSQQLRIMTKKRREGDAKNRSNRRREKSDAKNILQLDNGMAGKMNVHVPRSH
jgi:hypothetical protein